MCSVFLCLSINLYLSIYLSLVLSFIISPLSWFIQSSYLCFSLYLSFYLSIHSFFPPPPPPPPRSPPPPPPPPPLNQILLDPSRLPPCTKTNVRLLVTRFVLTASVISLHASSILQCSSSPLLPLPSFRFGRKREGGRVGGREGEREKERKRGWVGKRGRKKESVWVGEGGCR